MGRVQDRERYGVRDEAPRNEYDYTKKLSDLDVKEMTSLLLTSRESTCLYLVQAWGEFYFHSSFLFFFFPGLVTENYGSVERRRKGRRGGEGGVVRG